MSAVDPTFPSRRADGGARVSAVFTMSSSDQRGALEDGLRRWLSRKEEYGVDLVLDLTENPWLEDREDGAIQVVFEIQPESVLWKAWLVELTAELSTAAGIKFVGFWDLIAGVPHPASIS